MIYLISENFEESFFFTQIYIVWPMLQLVINTTIPLYISVALHESMEVRLQSTSVVLIYGIPLYQW